MFKPISLEQFRNLKQIPNLDGLRGISILMVIFHHIPEVSHHLLRNLQSNSLSGVYLFLAISGFLITTLALREYRSTKAFSIKNFYIRRSLRLFPLHYAVLLTACFLIIGLGLGYPEQRQAFRERLLSYFFYFSNYYGKAGAPLSFLWSLAVEEQFYLFFSVIFFFFPRKSSIIFPLVLALNLALWPLSIIWENSVALRLFQYQQPTLLGVCLAYLFEFPTTYRLFTSLFCRMGVLLSAFVLCFLFLSLSVYHFNIAYPSFNISCTIILGISATFASIPILGGSVLSYIGKISYGIYLLHMFVLYPVKHFLNDQPALVFLIGAPVSIGVASLSYYYFEKPFLDLKKRFSSQRS